MNRLLKSMSRPAVLVRIIFLAYLLAVGACTLVPLHGMPHLVRDEPSLRNHIQLVPFARLDYFFARKQGFLNIVLFLPFGFGLPFIGVPRLRTTFSLALAASVSIELMQLALVGTGLAFFRYADVNDVIFNVTGALLGFGVFRLFAHVYRQASRSRTFAEGSIADFIRSKTAAHP